MRTVSEKELCHERLGDRARAAVSDYDTFRRVEVLIDEFLDDQDLEGKRAIDVGCGLGFFSARLAERGAEVIACDLGESLVERASALAGCEGVQADCLALTETFGEKRFDIVVSSECIEHTPDPSEAVRQMIGVLKPGGFIAISTPNIVWYPMVLAATRLKLRPFDGLENFSSWRSLRKTLRKDNVDIVREKGLHLFPFQLGMNRLSRWFDDNGQVARSAMINICILGRKQNTD